MQSTNNPGGGQLWGYLSALLAAGMALYFARYLPQVVAGEILTASFAWAPSLGIGFSFLLDGLSLTFALLVSGIGALIFLYATGYMGSHPKFGYFTACLLSFMLAMLGLVLARDVITLFLFWELTAITSWLLIGFDNENPQARRNALQSLLVTSAGGLVLLAGLILMAHAAGSNDLALILGGEGLQADPLYTPILILVLIGAFTKSAQFPFHFWLPGAMAAPTPVSAFLHSATMVKAGIYLMARLHPTLSGTAAWEITLTLAGAITAVWAAIQALRQNDLKQALAQTTLMALGVATLMLAGTGPYVLTAVMVFIIVHAFYKAALFMVVGAIDHATGTREVHRLGALRRAMPVTAIVAAGAALSMAGLPPMLGWIGKELLYLGATGLTFGGIATALLLIANAFVFAVSGMVALRPFWGPQPDEPTTPEPHEVGWQMLTGPALLALGGLVFGLAAPTLLEPLLGAVVIGSLQGDAIAPLHLWGGLNLILGLSLATFALGTCLYLLREQFRQSAQVLERLPSFDRGWDRLIDGLKWVAGVQTRMLQTGHLSHYLAATIVVLTLTLGLTILLRAPQISYDFRAPLLVWLIAGFTSAGAILAVLTRSRIAAIAGIGTVGVGVALTFIYFGAPDVATTQLMVETLSAVLFGIAALRLPGMIERRRGLKALVHAGIAISFGLCFTLVILAVTSTPMDRQITEYFEEYSYSLAHGLNIVNVILVDFRAFDTFGELTVVLLASVGAWALLKRKGDAG